MEDQEVNSNTPTEAEGDSDEDVESHDGGGIGDGDVGENIPRLIITHIVNENFKSYAGKVTLGPFHQNFSCIIGPNGSGKSNVIDSMLFVFGYRASKIRSKKLSVLIHKSEQFTNLTSCSVEVHFEKIKDITEGPDEYLTVPNSKFYIRRVAHQNNSSEYLINGKKSTFKDVQTLLKREGIDLDHNRFLILQGEVEQIAMMKPKGLNEHEDGMLEYLEDIIGTSQYKDGIDELAKEVEDLNEHRSEKLARVKVVEKEKDALAPAKDEAIGYLKDENSLSRLKHKFYQCIGHANGKEHDSKSNELEEATVKIADIEKKDGDINKVIKYKDKEHQKVSQMRDKVKDLVDNVEQLFQTLNEKDAKLQEDLKHSKKQLTKLERDKAKKEEEFNKVADNPSDVDNELEQLKGQIVTFIDDKKEFEKRESLAMEELRSETKELQKKKEGKEREVLELSEGVRQAKAKLDMAAFDFDMLKSEEQRLTKQFEESKAAFSAATDGLRDKQTRFANANKSIPNKKRILDKTRADLDFAKREELKFQDMLRSTRAKTSEARSAAESTRNRSGIVRALITERDAGRITGIHGRLGDLGAIDERYDVAVSTAVGGLDNIIVDTMEVAQQCVAFIRANNLGVATFVGLDKMEEHRDRANQPVPTPDGCPRLFDLIRVQDELYRAAFYFAVRDTLVADDLSQANRVAYGRQRWRVVTLRGELIETSGTMSGGGTRVSRGRMGSRLTEETVTPQQLEALDQEVATQQEAANHWYQEARRLEPEVERLRRDIEECEVVVERLRLDIEEAPEMERAAGRRMRELEVELRKAKPDANKVKHMEEQVGKSRKSYEDKLAGSREVEKKVKEIQDKIIKVTNDKLKPIKTHIANQVKNIEEAKKEIAKLQLGKKTAERNLKRLKTQLEKCEGDVEGCKKSIVEISEEINKNESEAEEMVQNRESKKTELVEIETRLKDLKTELNNLQAEELEIKNVFLEAKHHHEKLKDVVKVLHQKVSQCKRELARLELNDIDGEETVPYAVLVEEEIEEADLDKVSADIAELEEKIKAGQPNLGAIAAYKKNERLYLDRVGELDAVTVERDAKRTEHDTMKKTRLEEFMKGFLTITHKLKEMYQMITLGGDAELELVDSLDPFSEGIQFSVRPPKKSWKNICNLSGGEKTLSSLALVFALHHYKPTPLYVMDEIDAALDYRNVSIVANYIKERTRDAQFVIISLRNQMFELGDHLVGIYKTHDCTKSVVINPKAISESAQT